MVADNQEIDVALFVYEYTAREQKLDVAALRDFTREPADIVEHFDKDTLEFVEENKLFVHNVELFAVLIFAFQYAYFLQIFELAANGIYLFVEFARELADEVFFVRIEQKELEELNSGR